MTRLHPLALDETDWRSHLPWLGSIDYTFPMPFRTGFVFMLSALAAFASSAIAQYQPTTQERINGCVRVLRQGVHPRSDSLDLAVLGSLRELGDPSLKPLWFQLAQQDRWEAQVHAVLALSELTPDQPADAWMISQLDSVDAQRAVIATLLDNTSLTTEQCHQLLESNVLDPVTELWILSSLVKRGATVEETRLREIARTDDIDLVGLAACLLAQHGDTALLEQHLSTVAGLSEMRRNRHLAELFIAIEQYRLTESLDWMSRVLEEVEIDRVVRWQAVRALLVLAPARGVAQWKRQAVNVTSDGEWVRALLLLLDAGADVPVETYGMVPRENPLLKSMVAAGEALSTNQSAAQPLIALIDMGHIGTAGWALGRAERLPTDEARAVYLHVIERIESQQGGRDERAELAVAATEMLYTIDPTAALNQLLSVADDSLTQEVMLLGFLRCHGSDIGAAAKQLRRIGTSRADSITLILLAKHSNELSKTELNQLGIVAAGGGQLATALQAQAAWLYLKHTGKIEQALNRIFAKG